MYRNFNVLIMMKKFFYIVFSPLVFLTTTNLFAQKTTEFDEIKEIINIADKLFWNEDYQQALHYFEVALSVDNDNAEIIFKTAVCYLHTFQREKSLNFIQKADRLDTAQNSHFYYWYANIYQQNYLFDLAIENYYLYLERIKLVTPEKEDTINSKILKKVYLKALKIADTRKVEIQNYIKQCNLAKDYLTKPRQYSVENLGPQINSAYSEHSPVISSNDSMLLFCSIKDISENINGNFQEEALEDIFASYKTKDGKWAERRMRGKYFNTKDNQAAVQLFDNDMKLLIYQYSKHGGDLYISEKKDDKWSIPKSLVDINTKHNEASAHITADGKTIYFSSDHFNKGNDLDLYKVEMQDDGSWSYPENLGPDINTNDQEDAAFISENGKTLYFSSKGHPGVGGFDIFRSQWDSTSGWSDPVNLGMPLNTPDDDIYYYLSEKNKGGYLASYRKGGFGMKDIYYISPIPKVTVKGKVEGINTTTGEPIEDITVNFIWVQDSAMNHIYEAQIQEGNYSRELISDNSYFINILKNEVILHKEIIEIPVSEDDSLVINKNISFNYTFPEDTITQLFSEDTSFTDTITVLSGVITDALSKQSLWARIIIINNEKNQIISNQTSDSVTGEYKIYIPSGKNYGFRVEKQDYMFHSENFNIQPSDYYQKIIKNISLQKLTDGTKIVLKNVFFEYGTDTLRNESISELDKLVDILRGNPNLAIRISGHTDNVSPVNFNQQLSENRAKYIVNYFIAHGIDFTRLKFKGYGKKQPIASNDTEEGRKLNRRVEFEIIRD